MDKKGMMHWKNIIGLILLLVIVVFLVLFVKNQGSLPAVWQDISGLFGVK
jgi:hypothetical protein